MRCLSAPGKAPASWPKKLAFQRLLGHVGALDSDEGPGPAGRIEVHGSGQKALARADLAGKKHGGVKGRKLAQIVHKLPEGRGFRHHIVKTVHHILGTAQVIQLVIQAAVGHHPCHGAADTLGQIGRHYKITGPFPHGLHNQLRLLDRAGDDHRG